MFWIGNSYLSDQRMSPLVARAPIILLLVRKWRVRGVGRKVNGMLRGTNVSLCSNTSSDVASLAVTRFEPMTSCFGPFFAFCRTDRSHPSPEWSPEQETEIFVPGTGHWRKDHQQQQPNASASNPGYPDDGVRKNHRKLIQFFPVASSPKRRRDESDSEIRHPLKGFIGSAYASKDNAGDFLFSTFHRQL